MSEPAIRKALTVEEMFLQQDKERYLYEMREKALLDYISNIEGAKEEGRAEGIAVANKEMASKLLKLGMSLSDIIKNTGLPEEEIKKMWSDIGVVPSNDSLGRIR